jgi:hypothetical protein
MKKRPAGAFSQIGWVRENKLDLNNKKMAVLGRF